MTAQQLDNWRVITSHFLAHALESAKLQAGLRPDVTYGEEQQHAAAASYHQAQAAWAAHEIRRLLDQFERQQAAELGVAVPLTATRSGHA